MTESLSIKKFAPCKDFLDRIEELLREQNLNRSDFAKLMAVRPSTVTRILRGETEVTPGRFRAICSSLKTTPEWLLTGEGKKNLTGIGALLPIHYDSLDCLYPLTKEIILRAIEYLGDLPEFEQYEMAVKILSLFGDK